MIRKPQSGQALALTAISLAALLAFAGLAIDMGVLRYEKHLQQTAADAAAIAGVYEIHDGSGSDVISAGQDAAAANYFKDNQVGIGTNDNISTCTSYAQNAPVSNSTVLPVCVEINNPPQSGPHNLDPNYVEAYVAADHPTYFMKIFGITNRPVVARAVATLVGQSGTGSGCVYASDQSSTHGVSGVKVNGGAYVLAPNCGFYDDGSWFSAGNPYVCAASIGYLYPNSGSGGLSSSTATPSSQCPSPATPTQMAVPQTDPLVNYVKGITNGETTPQPFTLSSIGTTTDPTPISPGTYSTNVDITSGDNVAFQPGTYYLENGITINGTATATGVGVTFVILGGSVMINGSGNVTLSAPDTGQYAGILFYQVPSDSGASNTATINGNSSSYFQGALYFPSELVTFGGNTTGSFNAGADYTIIVASDVQFSGNATIALNSNYSSLPGGVSPIQNAILVE